MAMVGYFQIRHDEEGLDAEGIINEMISLERETNRVKKEIADTVSAIVKIAGKSSRSVQMTCSLLKLSKEIQNAVREGMIGVSQGYILAANIDHPYLMDIFQQAVADGFTNDGLEKALKKGRPKVRSEIARKKPFSLFRRSVQSVRSGIEEQEDAFKKSDLEALLNDLHDLVVLVEGRAPGGDRQRRPCSGCGCFGPTRDHEEKSEDRVADVRRRVRSRSSAFVLLRSRQSEWVEFYSERVILRVPPRPRISWRWM